MRKLVIAFPYYEKDRAATMRLAKFICELEPKYRDDCTLFFYARFDALPITPSEMMRFITSFPVEWGRSTTEIVGHPAGANAQAKDLFRFAYESVLRGPWTDVDALLLLEADCVPVAKDWIDRLLAEWDARHDYCLVAGCHRTENVDVPHVNGNALWDPALAKHISVDVDCHGFGWDSAWAEKIGGNYLNTPLISNLFRETNVPEERLRVNPFHSDKKTTPVLIHGIKDRSAIDYAEKMTGAKFPI